MPKISVAARPEEVVGGFFTFLREKAVVGLAVAFVVGTQVQGLVKALIEHIIDPAFKLFLGERLSKRTFTFRFADNVANFGWGAVVYALLNFLFVVAAIYAIIKIFKLDKLDLPKDKK